MSTVSGGIRRGADQPGWNLYDELYPEFKRSKMPQPIQTADFAEYYVVSHANENEDLKKASPFLIKKALTSCIGDGSTTKRLRDGQLLIRCKNERQSKKLLAMTSLGGFYPIKVTEHKSLNECKGTIYCYDLKFIPDAEILAELASQKVTEVRKIKKKVNGELQDTALLVITFKSSTLPRVLDVGIHSCLVRQYIPSPLHCLNCFKYGHPKKYCRSERVCALCSEPFHEGDCKISNKCVNCKEPNNNHNNWSKDCARFKSEQEIQKISVTDRISNSEARKKFKIIHPDLSYPTYASKLNGIALTTNQSDAPILSKSRLHAHKTTLNENQESQDAHAHTNKNTSNVSLASPILSQSRPHAPSPSHGAIPKTTHTHSNSLPTDKTNNEHIKTNRKKNSP